MFDRVVFDRVSCRVVFYMMVFDRMSCRLVFDRVSCRVDLTECLQTSLLAACPGG